MLLLLLLHGRLLPRLVLFRAALWWLPPHAVSLNVRTLPQGAAKRRPSCLPLAATADDALSPRRFSRFHTTAADDGETGLTEPQQHRLLKQHHKTSSELGFWDEARIEASGGDGGNGCLAFRREKSMPLGGPSGGNGGHGGSVILVCDAALNTLGVARRKSRYAASPGPNGQGAHKHGRRAPDVIVRVPPGTIVREWEPPHRIAGELVHDGESIVVARGGRGGRGNAAFKTERQVAPRIAERGEKGAERVLKLELRLAADVGLVGKPNAGKSTLLAAATSARPKIADYAFTTLVPNLGVWEPKQFRRSRSRDGQHVTRGKLATRARRSKIGGIAKKRRRQSHSKDAPDFYDDEILPSDTSAARDEFAKAQLALALGLDQPQPKTPAASPTPKLSSVDDERGLVLADVPGLVENAHHGAGMGDAFLKHIERCRVLLHVVDASAADPLADLVAIDVELTAYSALLAQKPRVVALNKCDVLDRAQVRKLLLQIERFVGHRRIAPVSAIAGTGVNELMANLKDFIDTSPRGALRLFDQAPKVDFDPPFANSRGNPDRSFTLLDGRDLGLSNTWRIKSPRVEKIASMTNFDLPDAVARFGRQLHALGVAQALQEQGAQEGDLVMIGDDIDLEYDPHEFAKYPELSRNYIETAEPYDANEEVLEIGDDGDDDDDLLSTEYALMDFDDFRDDQGR